MYSKHLTLFLFHHSLGFVNLYISLLFFKIEKCIRLQQENVFWLLLFLLGLCGGSASGKTTVANRIIEALDVPWVSLLSLDSFYKVLTICPHSVNQRFKYQNRKSWKGYLYDRWSRMLKVTNTVCPTGTSLANTNLWCYYQSPQTTVLTTPGAETGLPPSQLGAWLIKQNAIHSQIFMMQLWFVPCSRAQVSRLGFKPLFCCWEHHSLGPMN